MDGSSVFATLSVPCLPSPCTRLSRVRTTTQAPPPSIHHLQSPWLAQLRCRAVNRGSHVPVLDLHLVGGILYPWRCRATICEEIIVAESVIQTRQWRTSSPTNSDRITPSPI